MHMFRRTLGAGILLLLLLQSAMATPLTDSVARAARQAAVQPGVRSIPDNPMTLPAIALMAGGTSVAIWGLVDRNYNCSNVVAAGVKSAFGGAIDPTVGCDSSPNKALLFGGLATIGAGIGLYFAGEHSKRSPELVVGRGGVAIRQKFSF